MDENFKQLWAYNGASISLFYGADSFLKKTYNSYFTDVERQFSINLFLGFKSDDSLMQLDAQLASQLNLRESEFIEVKDKIVFIGTWNVAAIDPVKDLSKWFNTSNVVPDIYVIGIQEIVSLTGKSVWNADEQNAQVNFFLSFFFLLNL